MIGFPQFAISLLILMPYLMWSQTATWSGNANDLLWHSDSNWVNHVVPQPGDSVLISDAEMVRVDSFAGPFLTIIIERSDIVITQDGTLLVEDGQYGVTLDSACLINEGKVRISDASSGGISIDRESALQNLSNLEINRCLGSGIHCEGALINRGCLQVDTSNLGISLFYNDSNTEPNLSQFLNSGDLKVSNIEGQAVSLVNVDTASNTGTIICISALEGFNVQLSSFLNFGTIECHTVKNGIRMGFQSEWFQKDTATILIQNSNQRPLFSTGIMLLDADTQWTSSGDINISGMDIGMILDIGTKTELNAGVIKISNTIRESLILFNASLVIADSTELNLDRGIDGAMTVSGNTSSFTMRGILTIN